MKLWSDRDALDRQVEEFTVGADFRLDQALVPYDCLGSIAHARMLGRVGVLDDGEVAALVEELERIKAQAARGEFEILREQEDCHTAIEAHLTATLGKAGAKIHTGRSRNDQVLTALRLYCKAELASLGEAAAEFSAAVKGLVKRHGKTRLPGYTHTRKAMPSSVRLWGTAFVDSMRDNQRLVSAATKLVDQCPLGTGAGYGVPLDLDRKGAAAELGFSRVQQNPVYAQLSRGKFEATVLHAATQVMYDLNRAASDLILFTLPELGYFRLPRKFTTGSSIMPQKRNPDVLELVRARYHVACAREAEVKTLAGNLISGYHRDLQLTKEPLMRGLENARASLVVMTLVFASLEVDEERCRTAMSGELFATGEVYRLVEEGIPFREAYLAVSKKYD